MLYLLGHWANQKCHLEKYNKQTHIDKFLKQQHTDQFQNTTEDLEYAAAVRLLDKYDSKGLQTNFVGFQTNDILKVISKHFTLIAVSNWFILLRISQKFSISIM